MKQYKKICLGLAVSTLLLQFSCTPTPEPRLQIGEAYAINGRTYHPEIQPNYKEVGYASWYGHKFNRKRTANGDVFDKNQLTAAHKTLPLPSVVKITNLDNGKTLLVKVNDRGPFSRGRIIDVSEAAAKKLGFYGSGTAKVMIELDKEASIALMKDPRLRMKEATKKQILEAYTGNTPPLKRSQPSQTTLANNDTQPDDNSDITSSTSRINTKHPAFIVPKKPMQQLAQNLQPIQTNIPQEQAVVQNEQNIQAKPDAQIQAKPKELVVKKKPQQHIAKKPKAPQATEPEVQTADTTTAQPVKSATSDKLQSDTQAQLANNKMSTAPSPATTEKIAPAKTHSARNFIIQVASTTSLADAKKIISKLQNLSSKIMEATVNGKKYFRVHVINLASQDETNLALNIIKSKGFKDAFIIKNR